PAHTHPTTPASPTRRSSDLDSIPPKVQMTAPTDSATIVGGALQATITYRDVEPNRTITLRSDNATLVTAQTAEGDPASMRTAMLDRKSTRLNSSHLGISYAV